MCIRDRCKHVGKSLKCCELSMQDIRKFHQAFYSEKNKQMQDSFILKYTQSESPKRMRPRGERKLVKESINNFLVPKTVNGETELVKACKKASVLFWELLTNMLSEFAKHILKLAFCPQKTEEGTTNLTIFWTRKLQ